MRDWNPCEALPLEGVRILVVEDEPLIAMCVEAALQEFGAIVFVAMSEADAYRLLEQVCSFELLMTDVNLGDGGSGFDVARIARQRDPATAVIYLSGRSESAVRKGGVARAEYLSKPVSEAALIRTAAQAVATMRSAVEQ
ncbi:MAG TPA: response regulator [Sphingomonas sp.]|nr:response regulator [Sphingomonas sp.]